MAQFVYETADKAGHDPYLAFNRVNLSKDIRIWDIPSRGLSVTYTKTTVEGMEAKFVPRVLPEFEFFNYVLNDKAWNDMIGEADVCFAVGGNNQCAHPFARAGRRFGCWVATPLWEDRVDRINNASLPICIRDRLSKPILERIERDIYREADLVYALSEHTADAIITDCGADRNSVKIVPYPIDTSKFSPTADERSDEPICENETNKIILFVARYADPRKNTAMLLAALDRVRAAVPDVKLYLVGDEPTDALRAKVDKLKLGDAVKFIDYVDHDELPTYYRAGDVFAIPSNHEGLAIAGLEALASGTPVVSTRCGGPEDYMTDGETGILVPRSDPESMASELIRLLTHDVRRDQMGETARQVIKDRFDRDKLKTHFLNAFEQLAES